MSPITIWVVFGTRPEAIKMQPLILAMKKDPRFNPVVCITAQHRQMLDQVMSVFGVKADIDLDVMTVGQTLPALTSKIITKMTEVLTGDAKYPRPDRILVHGDTTTTMATSIASYYEKIPVGHVEAGLRTFDLYSPFPEEGNRQITKVMADMHFSPTKLSTSNLIKEGVSPSRIFETGNTVIDALIWMKSKLVMEPKLSCDMSTFVEDILSKHKQYILVTAHRRENHGKGFDNICAALKDISLKHSDTAIVYPVHPNPAVRKPVEEKLGGIRNIYLIEPKDYAPFIYLMMNSKIILTDSGGVQEEAPSLGKPVLVMRDVTERQEAVDAGTVKLVGSNKNTIIDAVNELLTNDNSYKKMSTIENPYGDGMSSEKILDAIAKKHNLIN